MLGEHKEKNVWKCFVKQIELERNMVQATQKQEVLQENKRSCVPTSLVALTIWWAGVIRLEVMSLLTYSIMQATPASGS